MMTQLYKILVEGRAIHKAESVWSLPRLDDETTDWIPGDWYSLPKTVAPGTRHIGFCLTDEPYSRYRWGCQLYEAEGEGLIKTDQDQTYWQRARLLRPVENPDWWDEAVSFVNSIETTAFFQPKDLDPNWHIFDTYQQAEEAAGQHVLNPHFQSQLHRQMEKLQRKGAWQALTFRIFKHHHDLGLLFETMLNAIALAGALVLQDQERLDPTWLRRERANWAVWQAGYCRYTERNHEQYVYRDVTSHPDYDKPRQRPVPEPDEDGNFI